MNLLQAAAEIARFLEDQGIPYFIIGGLALQYWDEPRLTRGCGGHPHPSTSEAGFGTSTSVAYGVSRGDRFPRPAGTFRGSPEASPRSVEQRGDAT